MSETGSTARPGSKVLFVGAMGRSGSTVLELMLGAFDGFTGVGELRYVWQMGLLENRLCECGQPFRLCPFWQRVGEEAFDGWNVDFHRVLTVKNRLERHRALPALWRRVGGTKPELLWYADILTRLYNGIQAVTGASVIVDSSKIPPYLFMLRRVSGVDLRLLHLVRDPRGVVYSWKKRVPRPDVPDGETYMPTFSTSKSVGLWIDYNLMYHLAGLSGTPRMFLRYEDFIAAPRESMTRVLEFVGAEVSEQKLHALGQPRVPVRGSHAIGGNPVRFGAREMVLKLDLDWKTELPPAVRRSVYAATLPLARTYGYSSS